MSVLGYILFLTIGWVTVYFIFNDEKQRFNNGKMGLYVKACKANCSERDFIAKLKVSIFKSFVIRFILIGTLAFGTLAFIYIVQGESSGGLEGFSMLELLVMWVSFSMIAMVNRAGSAMWNRF